MKVALIEVTHWHVPLYLDALAQSGVEVVGVSDALHLAGPRIGARFGCPVYASHRELLARRQVDFAFVFGRHLDMPAMAVDLIERGIPFAIEKPGGILADDVERLADLAERRRLFVAVPFILRLSDAVAAIRASEGGQGPEIDHAHFRFVAGPPQRYPAAQVPWMLDPAIAGGGPLLNVGIHFVDMFQSLIRDRIASVSALATSRINGLPIEDFISVRMQTSAGAIATLESGYSFPSDAGRQRDLSFFLRSRRAYYHSEGDTIVIRSPEGSGVAQRAVPVRHETDVYYPEFVHCVLRELAGGAPPVAGLRDVARCLRVIEAAYASARQGGVTIPLAVQ